MSWFRKLRRKFGKKKGYRFPNGIPRTMLDDIDAAQFHRVYTIPTQTTLDVLESHDPT